MLDIIINNKKFKYINSLKIDDKSFIAYSDEENIYISSFHYENGIMIVEEIDQETLLEVKEILV